eukprot:g24452.t1
MMAANPAPAWDSLDFGDKWIKTLRAVSKEEAIPVTDLVKDLVDRWGLGPKRDASSSLVSLKLKREQWQKAQAGASRYIDSVEIWLPRDFEAEKVILPLRLLSWASRTKLLMLRHVELSWQAGPDPRLSVGELWLHHVSFRVVGAQQPPRPARLHVDLAGSIRAVVPLGTSGGVSAAQQTVFATRQETNVFPGPLLRELATGPCWPAGAAPEACKCTLHGLHSERTSVQGLWADRLVLAEAPRRRPGENETPARSQEPHLEVQGYGCLELQGPYPRLTLAWHTAGLPAWFSRDLLKPTDCRAQLALGNLPVNTVTTRPRRPRRPRRAGRVTARAGRVTRGGGRPRSHGLLPPPPRSHGCPPPRQASSSLARATAAAAYVYPWLLAAAEFPPGSAGRLGFLLELQLRHGLVLSARGLEAWAGLG